MHYTLCDICAFTHLSKHLCLRRINRKRRSSNESKHYSNLFYLEEEMPLLVRSFRSYAIDLNRMFTFAKDDVRSTLLKPVARWHMGIILNKDVATPYDKLRAIQSTST